jgi:hypothetical protein
VTALPILDWLHFHFSHHIEHHLFPTMASDSLPQVRTWLQQRVGDRYFAPPFGAALVAIFRTPRLYSDPVTLVDPERGTRRALADVERELRGGSPGIDRGPGQAPRGINPAEASPPGPA